MSDGPCQLCVELQRAGMDDMPCSVCTPPEQQEHRIERRRARWTMEGQQTLEDFVYSRFNWVPPMDEDGLRCTTVAPHVVPCDDSLCTQCRMDWFRGWR